MSVVRKRVNVIVVHSESKITTGHTDEYKRGEHIGDIRFRLVQFVVVTTEWINILVLFDVSTAVIGSIYIHYRRGQYTNGVGHRLD